RSRDSARHPCVRHPRTPRGTDPTNWHIELIISLLIIIPSQPRTRHAVTAAKTRICLYSHGCSPPAEDVCRSARASVWHLPRAVGGADAHRSERRSQAIGTCRDARLAADHAHAPARPPRG